MNIDAIPTCICASPTKINGIRIPICIDCGNLIVGGAGTGKPVDGGGRPLPEHCASLAAALDLSPRQAALLLAELRNALVPASMALEMMPGSPNVDLCARAVERALTLTAAIQRREFAKGEPST